MGQARDILASKTSPSQVRVPLLVRPRLTDLIREAETRKLLVLSADAGYGKTSLLLSALPDLTLPVAWLSLDAADADATFCAPASWPRCDGCCRTSGKTSSRS